MCYFLLLLFHDFINYGSSVLRDLLFYWGGPHEVFCGNYFGGLVEQQARFQEQRGSFVGELLVLPIVIGLIGKSS